MTTEMLRTTSMRWGGRLADGRAGVGDSDAVYPQAFRRLQPCSDDPTTEEVAKLRLAGSYLFEETSLSSKYTIHSSLSHAFPLLPVLFN